MTDAVVAQTGQSVITNPSSPAGHQRVVGAPAIAATGVVPVAAVLPPAVLSSAYSENISSAGGTAPYTFALSTGSSLPPGLNISSAGLISGTPTLAGNYSFSIVSTDSNGNSGTTVFQINVGSGTGAAGSSFAHLA